MFGLTHERDGMPIMREPRILKVGIGLPRGRGLEVWQHPTDKLWYFRKAIPKKGPGKGVDWELLNAKSGIPTREKAEEFYYAQYPKAEIVNYPRKLSFFFFTKPVVMDDGGEAFVPDFEAIEAHGPQPREIDIVFLDDNPFTGAYQMWSTSELRCKGDGINAMRVLSMANSHEEQELKKLAEAKGERYFPIVGGCWTGGCQYAGSDCKPGGDLKFQLAQNIRVGGTAYFHTTGFRSISQIFSSLERIKSLTGGRLTGVPLKMCLRPYKARHEGKTSLQYGVSLEFRAEDVGMLREKLAAQVWSFNNALNAPTQYNPGIGRAIAGPVRGLAPRAIEPAEEPVSGIAEGDEHPLGAAVIHDEFYASDGEDYGEEEGGSESRPGAAVASDAKTAELRDRLAAQQAANQQKAAADKTRNPSDKQAGDLV
jgi:hypothetical protein